MIATRSSLTFLVAASLLLPNAQDGFAQTIKRPELTSAEARVIGSCLALIRSCQLPDGSFNMLDEGKAAGDPVWIAPYFVQHAALALLAANDVKKNYSDMERVGKWLDWCVKHQESGGFWNDTTGTIARNESNGKVDAHDSSAAMFLLVAERYRHSGSKLSPQIVAAAKASLKCIQNVTDTDGLTWAKPDYKVKFLMDNVEVYAGMASAEQLFKSTMNTEEAALAGKHLAAMKEPLLAYWEGSEKDRFAWGLLPSGQFNDGLVHIYPHGLAQLFGVSFIAAEPAPFRETLGAFTPQTRREGVGAERFLIAASRLGEAETKAWRLNVVQDAVTFTPQSVYIFRPALVVLSLLEGADWMPSVVASAPP